MACLSGDASLKDTRRASPVQLAVAKDVGFGSPRESSGLGPIRGKLSSDEAIKERDSPVHALVGLGRLRVDFHDLGLGRRGHGDRGGLGPCDGLDRWALSCHRGVVNGRLVEVSGEDVQGDQGPC